MYNVKWDTLQPVLKVLTILHWQILIFLIQRISAVNMELISSLGRACFSSLDFANLCKNTV